jgi:hypothetical protein
MTPAMKIGKSIVFTFYKNSKLMSSFANILGTEVMLVIESLEFVISLKPFEYFSPFKPYIEELLFSETIILMK